MPLRILLVTPKFYGIENKIKSSLEESDYSVVWIENKILTLDFHGPDSKWKAIRKLYFYLFSPQKRYIKRKLKKIEDHNFDILFSINAHIICSWLIKYLKLQNPKLHSVLYIWDSFLMFNLANELKYFDRVFTFDPEDSKSHNIEYKPNFFIENNQQNSLLPEYDLFFVGKFSTARLLFIDIFLRLVENIEIKYYIKLWPAYKIFFHSGICYSILRIINPENNWVQKYILNYEAVEGILKRDYIISDSMSFEEVQQNFFSSNVILDLSYQGQAGYTHRLIEALANGKKVITTNSNIKNESFFDSEQIRIIDSQNTEIDSNWIKEKKTFAVDSFIFKLNDINSLKNALDEAINSGSDKTRLAYNRYLKNYTDIMMAKRYYELYKSA